MTPQYYENGPYLFTTSYYYGKLNRSKRSKTKRSTKRSKTKRSKRSRFGDLVLKTVGHVRNLYQSKHPSIRPESGDLSLALKLKPVINSPAYQECLKRKGLSGKLKNIIGKNPCDVLIDDV